jgi:hypothetical protein
MGFSSSIRTTRCEPVAALSDRLFRRGIGALQHVEALSALRDHERSSFAGTAPATAPVDWFRALRDVTAMLRSWSGDLSCGAVHQDPPSRSSPPAAAEWNRFIRADVDRRHEQEVESSKVPIGDGA